MDAETIIQGGGLILSGAAVGKIADVAIRAWTARHHKGEVSVTPDPLNVRMEDKFVPRDEFNRHVEQNAAEHKAMVDDRERNYEALYNRQLANDKLTSEIKGKLDGIKDDLSLIKNKLFKTR